MTIRDLQPQFYDDIREFKLLADIEDELFNELQQLVSEAQNNSYVSTSNEKGIEVYEKQLDIIANPTVENLQFRRERVLNRIQMQAPFTLNFLKEKLDSIIGKGKYVLTMDYNKYTMYLELAFDNADWFREASITINSIKPANIKYIMIPVIFEKIVLSEKLVLVDSRPFKIGISRIGIDPLKVEKDKEVYVLD